LSLVSSDRILSIVVAGLAAIALLAPAASQGDEKLRAGGDRDCSDFNSQAAAQNFFENNNPGADPHGLDADNDGVACESNPCPCSTGGGGGGNDGGGGGGNNEPKPPETKRDHARVVRVIDGDTVEVKLDGQKQDVRLIGIDTPEVHGGEECGGDEASRSARDLLPVRSRVLLISDTSQDNKDRYGRLLRYVERFGKDVNRTQVLRGWADVYVYNDNPFKRVKGYREAKEDARKHDRGVWGVCNGHF
jgi:endonuclease YncB( thermonuclease family)